MKISGNFDWRHSPAHIELLSKFTKGREVAQVLEWQYLKDILKEPTKIATDRFVKEGMLVSCTTQETLPHLFTVADLKGMLIERDLSTSGRKADLINTLINADKLEMEKMALRRNYLKCSDEALTIIETFEEKRSSAEQEAKLRSFDYLATRDFKNAYKVFLEYHRKYSYIVYLYRFITSETKMG